MWKTTVNSVGPGQANVVVTYKKLDGTTESKTVPVKYTVGSPTGVHISAEKLNVLYVGLENEISVSGGSKGAEAIDAKISSGNLTKKGGGVYVATFDNVGSGKATITAIVDGKSTTKEFKVKSVPEPVGKVGNSKGGFMPLNEFKATAGVRADLENFVFDGIKYDVLGYTVICVGKAFAERPGVTEVSGAAFDGATLANIQKLTPNSTVMIDRIKVRGPGGTFTIPPISFFLR